MATRTATALPPEIVIEPLFPEGTRFILPRRDLGKARWVGLAPIVIGLLFCIVPLSWAWELAQAMPGGGFDPFLALFLLFLLPFVGGGLVPIAIGLAAVFGHSEVEVRDGKLRSSERIGFLRWSRAKQLEQVHRLVVRQPTRPERRSKNDPFSDLVGIWVETDRPKPWIITPGYPRSWLEPLAQELAKLCNTPDPLRSMSEPEADEIEAVVAEEENVLPEISDRYDQPTGSKIICEQSPGRLTFNVPRAGVLHGSSKGLFWFAAIWCVFISVFTVPWVFNLGNMAVVEMTMLLGMLAIFWAVGMGLLLFSIHLGRRRAAIAAVGQQLMVLQTGLFGSKSYEWTRDEISSIGVGPSGMSINNVPVLELQITSADGKKLGLLAGRDTEELAWMATLLREALDLPVKAE
jgi:hypothetical protein